MAEVEDIKCILVECVSIMDWWTIERAEHDGNEWVLEHESDDGFGSYSSWCRSARLGEASTDPQIHNNADIEGTSSEMRSIAEAIQNGGSFSARRCEAKTWLAGVALSSPRNSNYPVVITHARAKELAADILAKLAQKNEDIIP